MTPGPDEQMGTADDRTETLHTFKREIRIEPITGRDDIRSLTVVISYQAGSIPQKYTLTTYISAFA